MSKLSTSALILKDIVKPDKIVETHISVVMLAGEFVYKIKKPVDFGFLDFKLLSDRKKYCLLEKNLNERFTNGVYEEVLKIARRGNEFVLVPYYNTLTTVDYVLKMKRIDDTKFLSTKVKNKQVSTDDMKVIGENIARLFKNIVTNPEYATQNGSYDLIVKNCEENFEQTKSFVGRFIPENYYTFIKDKTLNFLKANKNIFNKRLVEGYVVDGHGDLRLEHIFEDENGIGVMDCIEFNKRFRYNDAVSDFAFLLMELDQNGEILLSDACLKGFTKVYNDDDTLNLLNFYKCYRAYVRVKIACFMLSELEENSEIFTEEKTKLERLLKLALTYSVNMETPKIIIYYGLMGSGKSKNSKKFSEDFPSVRINTDEFRKNYFSKGATEKVYEDFNEGIYSTENSKIIYKEISKVTKETFKFKRMVLVDGSFSKRIFYDVFSENMSITPLKILCKTSDEETMKRLSKRLNGNSVSDGRPELYYKQKESFEDIKADLVLNTADEITMNIEKVKNFMIDNEK